jgi:Na+-translocating ferredoxin:NAD+ oxidoreductase subunit A
VDNPLLLIVGAALVDNVVLTKMLGLCPFMGASRKLEVSLGLGLATAFVLTLASALAYLIDNYLLEPNNLLYLRVLSFILVIAGSVGLTELYVRKSSPLLHRSLGIYLPLITTNCAVLGVPLLNLSENRTLVDSVLLALGSAIGFTLVLVLFASLRERLEGADVPPAFRGAPIALITAALMSIAFMGFEALVK